MVLSQEDHSRFRSVGDLVRDVRLHGYYGGVRLVKATIKKFVEYCAPAAEAARPQFLGPLREQHPPAGRAGRLQRDHRGHAAGLMEFYGVEIPLHVQPSLVLASNDEELGIAAGLQDRVIQVYEGAAL